MPARTCTVALLGAAAHLIEVETHITGGLPATILADLPDSTMRETRDRVRAAIVNSGEPWPDTKITVGLSPASLPKHGTSFDLAIAVSILTAGQRVPTPPPDHPAMYFAELGLDGSVRPVPGTLPAVLAAADAGITTVVVAKANAREASHVPGVHVVRASTLRDVAAWLRNGGKPPPDDPRPARPPAPAGNLVDLPGQGSARRATEICAAGGHNLSLVGLPGAGKELLAKRLAEIMPDLDHRTALEVTSIHSLAGVVPDDGIITRPPYINPHHTASMPAIVGGASRGLIRPGAASLAHRGVLYLDQAPEFPRAVLDALRAPAEAGEVAIARGGLLTRFPARFCLVLAACPCPCTAQGNPPANCACTPAARRRYLGRLSGSLLDSADLKVTAAPPPDGTRSTAGEAVQDARERVLTARERAARRLRGTPWQQNSDIPARELRKSLPVMPGADQAIWQAVDVGAINERSALRALRVAWTVADLAERDRLTADDCALALAYMKGDPEAGSPHLS
jgi:magnesium chelatase family protein